MTAAGPRRGHPLLVEGLLLMFPAAALCAMLTPLAWVAGFGLDLPFAATIPVGQWHAHEMVFGVYGAALAGFLTSAVPEWTDTPPRRGRALVVLLALWLPGRLVGLVGLDALAWLAAATDLAFLGLLLWYVVAALVARGSTRHASFALWVGLFLALDAGIHAAWLTGAVDLAGRLLTVALLVFLVFFSLSLSRINVVVLNLALDPSGTTTPYRPHPGRQNLAAGLVALYAAALLVAPQSTVPAWLALAAGAAFLDRLAEWFIGRPVLRSHVLALAAANGFAGLGLLLTGAAGLGAGIGPATGLHVLAVGGLGLAVLGVFVIAGLRHTGRPLELPWQAHAALGLMAAAAVVRVAPELGLGEALLGVHYGLAALLWSAAFAVWLAGFLPLFLDPRGGDGCA